LQPMVDVMTCTYSLLLLSPGQPDTAAMVVPFTYCDRTIIDYEVLH
jgi:hypothetical protein